MVVVESFVVEMDNVSCNVVQESSIVADYNDSLRVAIKVLKIVR